MNFSAARKDRKKQLAAAKRETYLQFKANLREIHDRFRREKRDAIEASYRQFWQNRREIQAEFFLDLKCLHQEEREKRAAFLVSSKEERENRFKERLATREKQQAQIAARMVFIQKLQEATAAAEAAGIKLDLPTLPPMPALPPARPLSDWQLMMKRVGQILTAADFEFQPGNKDVRLLAVFCSELLNMSVSYTKVASYPDGNILKAAEFFRESGGRPAMDDWQKASSIRGQLRAILDAM